MRDERKNQSFLKGAFILTVAGFIVKLLGALYRLPLARIIQDEGMGLYQMAYPIYVTLLSISTAGLPTAISKMVAEKRALQSYREAYRVFRVSLFILAFIGLTFTGLLFALSGFLAERVLANPKAYYPLISIAPAIFFVSVMSAFRGFFQGMQTMTPSAISQVVEQVGRVIAVFILVFLLLPVGVEYAAAGAAFGPVVGAIMGLLVLLLIYRNKRGDIFKEIYGDRTEARENSLSIAYRLFAFAIPITLGGLIIPVMNLADAAIVNRKLQMAGFTIKRATELYGQLTGLAGPLVNLPPIVTMALAASLVPAISEAVARNQGRLVSSRATAGVRVTMIFSLPAAVGLYTLATPICRMLYNNPEAGIPLSVLAFGVIFLSLNQTTAGILQGTGRTITPVKNLLMGAIIKVTLNYSLTGIPEINIRGAAIGTVAGYFVASMLNLAAVNRYIGLIWDIKQMLIIPAISTLSMAVSVMFSYTRILSYTGSNTISTLASVAIGSVIYGIMLLFLGGVRERDFHIIPVVGPRIAGIFKRLGLLRG
ncbi:MAG: stage V sporulation protein B [Firmicutes bacterium]|nr:stage V sporulation protein B [Bacillota bacterium]